VRRIGVLMPYDENDPQAKPRLSAFTQALADLGWTDGREVQMDLQWGRADPNRIRALAQELVGRQPDIILADSTAVTVALKGETRTIPIVFATAVDPVASDGRGRVRARAGGERGIGPPSLAGGARGDLRVLGRIAAGARDRSITGSEAPQHHGRITVRKFGGADWSNKMGTFGTRPATLQPCALERGWSLTGLSPLTSHHRRFRASFQVGRQP
jgi:hypothetical protein